MKNSENSTVYYGVVCYLQIPLNITARITFSNSLIVATPLESVSYSVKY